MNMRIYSKTRLVGTSLESVADSVPVISRYAS